MHDMDRTTLEFGQGMGYEEEQFDLGQGEWSGEGGQLSESQEVALASELLSVSNENELDQFLGSFIKSAGNVLRGPLGGVLKGIAKKALPLAGGALGGFIGGPLGAKIGSGLASAAGGALGLETEDEWSGEDREFEGARTFVKMAADTVNRAAQARGGDPRQIALQAATAAARQYAPGLLANAGAGNQLGQLGQIGPGGLATQSGASARGAASGARGRWVRHGRKIVLYGV